MQQDSRQETKDRRQDPYRRTTACDSDPDAYPGCCSEERVCEGAHDPPKEEGHTKLASLQRLKVVDDVLDEGESDPDEGAVDDAVEQAVHLRTAEDHDCNQEQAFAELLDDRSGDCHVDDFVGS